MRAAALRAIADADVIAYLHPLPEHPAPHLQEVARLEHRPRAPIVTVYTKADLVTPSDRPTVRPSDEVVVSAVAQEGADNLLDGLDGGLRVPMRPFHPQPR